MLREGEKWFYEVSEFFSSLTDIDNITYCGFDRANFGSQCKTCGVFEVSPKVIFTAEFLSKVQSYTSDRVLCMQVFETIGVYRHCVVVILR